MAPIVYLKPSDTSGARAGDFELGASATPWELRVSSASSTLEASISDMFVESSNYRTLLRLFTSAIIYLLALFVARGCQGYKFAVKFKGHYAEASAAEGRMRD